MDQEEAILNADPEPVAIDASIASNAANTSSTSITSNETNDSNSEDFDRFMERHEGDVFDTPLKNEGSNASFVPLREVVSYFQN
jgi:hypothetical protein